MGGSRMDLKLAKIESIRWSEWATGIRIPTFDCSSINKYFSLDFYDFHQRSALECYVD